MPQTLRKIFPITAEQAASAELDESVEEANRATQAIVQLVQDIDSDRIAIPDVQIDRLPDDDTQVIRARRQIACVPPADEPSR